MADFSFINAAGSIGHRKRGITQTAINSFEVTTAMIDNADDNLFVLELNSNDKLVDLKIFSDDLDSNASPTLAYNIGLAYGRNSRGINEFTIIDADCIGTAATQGQAASVTGAQLAFEARDIADINKELWEVAGLSSDPSCVFYLVMDLTTAAATPVAGTITIVAHTI